MSADDQESRYQRVLLGTTSRRGLPDIVVRLDRIPLTDTSAIEQTYAPPEPLERTFGGVRYVSVRDGHGYRILRKRDTIVSNNERALAWSGEVAVGVRRTETQRLPLLLVCSMNSALETLTAPALRRIILEQSKRANVGHIGSALSVVDIICALYDQVLSVPEPTIPTATGSSCRKVMPYWRCTARFNFEAGFPRGPRDLRG